jgi:flagellar protein FliS
MDSAYDRSSNHSNLTNYVQQKILSASPLEIVAMLYGKAIDEIREARQQLAADNIELRGKAIAKACDAICELDSSLNMETGGDLAKRLRGLYRYFLVRLLDANLQRSDEPLAEVLGLLSTLADGWQTIANDVGEPAPHTPVSCHQAEETSGVSRSWTL